MPHHDTIEVAGRIGDVFAHRFVIETTGGGKILADLGPKGAEAFHLEAGAEIVASGEKKPSELKVMRIARKGKAAIAIPHGPKHGPKHHHHHDDADPKIALAAVREVGAEPIGAPHRKPKHFEVLARKGRSFAEYHVELDGHIRKEKPVARDDHKWCDAIEAA